MPAEPRRGVQRTRTTAEVLRGPRIRPSDRVWLGVLGAVLLADLWRHRKGDASTLSDAVRRLLQTETIEGRAAFTGLMDLATHHILR